MYYDNYNNMSIQVMCSYYNKLNNDNEMVIVIDNILPLANRSTGVPSDFVL